MSRTSGVLLCLAYIIGLLVIPVSGANYGMLVIGAIAAYTFPRYFPRYWRTISPSWIGLLAGIIGCLASFYFSWRLPQPVNMDLSGWMAEPVIVQGNVISEPRLTRSQRVQFTLKATAIADQPFPGKLYTTVPLLQATGLHPGAQVEITGILYEPKPATIPGGFDFQAYLARKGIFAGLSAEIVKFDGNTTSWGWWRVRQRIIRSLVQGLDVPEGVVVGSMVMGRRAVDLPFAIRDNFIQVGLAHVLAASGFHVSLLLGLVLALTQRFPKSTQFRAAILSLILYSGLTGFQPSILRAALMGFGGLLGMQLDRRVNSLGSLLLTATILLLVNPLWIKDLGFQFSFLATLGLVVTAPRLIERWDGLPPAIASLLAVPISALIWILPLQLYQFGLVSPYIVVVNLVTLPLVIAITIGGMIIAVISVISPVFGSFIASSLYYPTQTLIQIIDWFSQLPGNSVAVGKISIVQLIVLYGLIFGFWLKSIVDKRSKRRSPSSISVLIATVFALTAIVVPGWHVQQRQAQVTIFPNPTPIIAVQYWGKFVLINVPDLNAAQYLLIPFFQSQGVNQLDASFTLDLQEKSIQGWLKILETLPVKNFYHSAPEALQNNPIQERILNLDREYQHLPLNQELSLDPFRFQGLNTEPDIFEFRLGKQRWLVFKGSGVTDNICRGRQWCEPDTMETILVWTGKGLGEDIIKSIQPEVAIALSSTLEPALISEFEAQNTQVFLTGTHGTIQWTSQQGFRTTSGLIPSKHQQF